MTFKFNWAPSVCLLGLATPWLKLLPPAGTWPAQMAQVMPGPGPCLQSRSCWLLGPLHSPQVPPANRAPRWVPQPPPGVPSPNYALLRLASRPREQGTGPGYKCQRQREAGTWRQGKLRQQRERTMGRTASHAELQVPAQSCPERPWQRRGGRDREARSPSLNDRSQPGRAGEASWGF